MTAPLPQISPGDYSDTALIKFLEWIKDADLGERGTNSSRRASVRRVLECLNHGEKRDLRQLDILKVTKRFYQDAQDFTEPTKAIYISRFKTTLRDFLEWKDDPLSFISKYIPKDEPATRSEIAEMMARLITVSAASSNTGTHYSTSASTVPSHLGMTSTSSSLFGNNTPSFTSITPSHNFSDNIALGMNTFSTDIPKNSFNIDHLTPKLMTSNNTNTNHLTNLYKSYFNNDTLEPIPIPLRKNVTVYITGVPTDLTTAEADKIIKIVEAYVSAT